MLFSSENTRSHDAEFAESANAMRAACDHASMHAGNRPQTVRAPGKQKLHENCTKLRQMDENCTKIARIASDKKCAEIAQKIARKIDLGQAGAPCGRTPKLPLVKL